MMNRRGSATILGLGVLLLVGVLIAALLPWTTAESRFGRNDQDAVQARYAAEAGVKRALAEFGLPGSKDWSWLNSAQQLTDTAGATYDVRIYHPPAVPTKTGYYDITSTGKAGGMTRVSKMPRVYYEAGEVYTTYAGGTLVLDGKMNVVSGTLAYNKDNSINPTYLNNVTCASDLCPVTNPTCCIVPLDGKIPLYNKSDYVGSSAPPTSWTNNIPNLTEKNIIHQPIS